MIERVQPLLPPGSQVRQIVLGGTRRPMPWFIWPFFLLGVLPGFLLLLIYALTTANRTLVVTSDAIFVLDCGRGGSQKPKSVQRVLPRATRLGPPAGTLNVKVFAGPEAFWTSKQFAGEIAAADAEAIQIPAPRTGFVMSPDGSHWWDGAGWIDCAMAAPASAPRSPDGASWWDGTQWRPLPAASGQVQTLS